MVVLNYFRSRRTQDDFDHIGYYLDLTDQLHLSYYSLPRTVSPRSRNHILAEYPVLNLLGIFYTILGQLHVDL